MTNKTTTFAVLEASAVSTLIASVKTSGARFDALVQRTATQCVAHSILHDNIDMGNDLLNALPKGSRRDSMVAWFEKFGNFAWMKGDKKLAFFKVVEKKDCDQAYLKEVSASPWTSGTKPAAIVSTYDLEQEFGKVLDRMGKLVWDSSKTIEHADLYTKLKAAYTAYVVESYVAPANDGEEQIAA